MNAQARRLVLVLAFLVLGCTFWVLADPPPGEKPNLGSPRIDQQQIVDGWLRFDELREAGQRIFTTPFNKLDGMGDGPMNVSDTVRPGGRPTLGGNGTFLRVNGLDSQTCLECHSIVSNATIPATLGIGGVGTAATNAMIMPTAMDPADLENLDSEAGFNGRLANPPFIFGAGAVELLGLEMTRELQLQKQWALDHPGSVVTLVAKGVSFGSIVADSFGEIDYSGLEGVDEDLVVKPFGRKGEFATTRDFDIEAMQFHFGMQPVEVVGEGNDGDGDGVADEILVGELSALHVFVASMPRPQQEKPTGQTSRGFSRFQEIGCAGCHMPQLETSSTELPLRFPAVPTDPDANVYFEVDLTRQPAKFDSNGNGGVTVPLFADLKRHDMGAALAEDFARVSDQRNHEFTTARLWGIADTAPYLHDGRATTLTEAILFHGGEAQDARDAFDALGDTDKVDLLQFLRSLRTPVDKAPGLMPRRATDRLGPSRGAVEISPERY